MIEAIIVRHYCLEVMLLLLLLVTAAALLPETNVVVGDRSTEAGEGEGGCACPGDEDKVVVGERPDGDRDPVADGDGDNCSE